MYSELADFYYVWLREILSDEYDYFTSEYTPKTSEVIKNKVQEKDEDDFAEMLGDVFSESRGKLKDDGIMAFTFHHKDTEAWGSVLGAVLDSRFKITAVYPVNSEMNRNMHIRDKGNIEYDMVVVCRKREEDPEEGIWSEMRDRIYLEAKDQIQELRDKERELSDGDIFVITVGKCLQIYSEHYPNVKKNGEKFEVEQALESIREVVDLQTSESTFDSYVKEVTEESAMFLAYTAGKESIDYSDLNKEFQQRGLQISKLLDLALVEKAGDEIQIHDVDEAANDIEAKHNPKSIERAFYLIHLENQDHLNEEMREWSNEETLRSLSLYGEVTEEKEYQKLANYVDEKTKDSQLDLWDSKE
jgi:adenine-specific DNA methylase